MKLDLKKLVDLLIFSLIVVKLRSLAEKRVELVLMGILVSLGPMLDKIPPSLNLKGLRAQSKEDAIQVSNSRLGQLALNFVFLGHCCKYPATRTRIVNQLSLKIQTYLINKKRRKNAIYKTW